MPLSTTIPVGRLRKRLAGPKWLGWPGPVWILRVTGDHYYFRTKDHGGDARRALLEHAHRGGWFGPATVRDVIQRCRGVEALPGRTRL